eukprot:gene17311-17501_t
MYPQATGNTGYTFDLAWQITSAPYVLSKPLLARKLFHANHKWTNLQNDSIYWVSPSNKSNGIAPAGFYTYQTSFAVGVFPNYTCLEIPLMVSASDQIRVLNQHFAPTGLAVSFGELDCFSEQPDKDGQPTIYPSYVFACPPGYSKWETICIEHSTFDIVCPFGYQFDPNYLGCMPKTGGSYYRGSMDMYIAVVYTMQTSPPSGKLYIDGKRVNADPYKDLLFYHPQ